MQFKKVLKCNVCSEFPNRHTRTQSLVYEWTCKLTSTQFKKGTNKFTIRMFTHESDHAIFRYIYYIHATCTCSTIVYLPMILVLHNGGRYRKHSKVYTNVGLSPHCNEMQFWLSSMFLLSTRLKTIIKGRSLPYRINTWPTLRLFTLLNLQQIITRYIFQNCILNLQGINFYVSTSPLNVWLQLKIVYNLKAYLCVQFCGEQWKYTLKD